MAAALSMVELFGFSNSCHKATQELLEAGVLNEDIVLGFYRPERRAITGFSVD